MKQKLIAIVIVVALLLTAGMVMAQRQRGMKSGRAAGVSPSGPGADCWAMGAGMGERLKKQLNLTDAQVNQLRDIRTDFMNSTQAQRTEIQNDKQQMINLWMAEPLDPAAIKSMAAQMDSVRAQIRDSAIDHAVQAFNVLNADQKAKVRSWIKAHPHLGMGIGCGPCCSAGMYGWGRATGGPKGAGAGRGYGAKSGKGAKSW